VGNAQVKIGDSIYPSGSVFAVPFFQSMVFSYFSLDRVKLDLDQLNPPILDFFFCHPNQRHICFSPIVTYYLLIAISDHTYLSLFPPLSLVIPSFCSSLPSSASFTFFTKDRFGFWRIPLITMGTPTPAFSEIIRELALGYPLPLSSFFIYDYSA
jgi:hypothetical protein